MYATICGWASQDEGAVAVSYTHLDVYKRQRKYLSHPEWFPAFLYVTLPLKSQQFLNNYAHYHLPVKQSYCKSNNFSDILIFSGPSDILLLIYYYFQIIYF